jgi:hypothetical protein
VSASKKIGQGGFRSTPFFSSSLHIKLGFPPFLSARDHGAVLGVLGSQGGGVGAQWEYREGLGDAVVL